MLTYKFRLYPTLEEENKLINTLEVCRYVYNYFITNKFKTRNDMNYALTELKQSHGYTITTPRCFRWFLLKLLVQ